MYFRRSKAGSGKPSPVLLGLIGAGCLSCVFACSGSGGESDRLSSGATAGAPAAGNSSVGTGGGFSGGVGGVSSSGGVAGAATSGSGGGATAGGSGTGPTSGGAGSGGVAGMIGNVSGAAGAALAGAGGTSGGNSGAAGSATAGGGAAAGASTGPAYPKAPGNGGDVAQGIAQLNLYRAALGLSMITLDDATSVGCSGHLDYLIEEAQLRNQTGYLEHTESNQSNSHYSAANEAAGKASDLAFGQSGSRGMVVGQSLAQAVDLWINGLYHRHPLLDPGLVKLGAASKQGYNCVNYGAAGNTTVLKPATPVLWPADGMSDVPRTFPGNEGPCPTASDPLKATSCDGSGFIVSATYYNWGMRGKSAIGSVTSAVLTNTSTGMPVPLFTWYADRVADHDPAPGYTPDEIALVPQAALPASTTFRVDIDAVVSGAATKLSWTFTTGTRNQ